MIGWILFTITVIFIIIWYVKKRFKISWQSLSSVLALLFSCFACIITGLRIEIHTTNDTFVGLMAGFMGACATILIGVQIYNSIDTRNSIKEINKSFEGKIKQLNISFDERMRESKVNQNILEYELRKTNKEIINNKEERKISDLIIEAKTKEIYGISIYQDQPFTAYSSFFTALKLYLEAGNNIKTKSFLSNMEALVSRIKSMEKQKIKRTDCENVKLIQLSELEKHEIYPLIEKRITTIHNEIINIINSLKK